jgi:hypothetical protein
MQQSAKIQLLEKEEGSRTAHLQPIIDFLKAHGNQPATADEFTFDRDGLGNYSFTAPLDIAAIQAHFEIPPTLLLNKNSVHDTRNLVEITQHVASGPPLTFAF